MSAPAKVKTRPPPPLPAPAPATPIIYIHRPDGVALAPTTRHVVIHGVELRKSGSPPDRPVATLTFPVSYATAARVAEVLERDVDECFIQPHTPESDAELRHLFDQGVLNGWFWENYNYARHWEPRWRIEWRIWIEGRGCSTDEPRQSY